ncbi:MAG: hypothetical protein COZ46_05030 [Verrucomicrobia bacterium CG_4_10_14_3_um_filter_43_23]|nr:MAG: hypothetical protein AUJ82_05340 [Verrucomicrobia bacterium CG1_02_43_26]PIP58750.1 MAG: hypothetical protein COX01_06980 [Verrucomicrobia bacterium CG22_combo_CG10-13_8_21_14_all_43_17]PIX58204.1 MAG: hypothetical protein COZ46_05030 [Verrucomicrobia bacterium CG_4_10_14_3_um_filter_43_23]PIY61539.1 MAG: hypothetical protein COY94_05025 [Verrucomicrobia bacterium CG_4_10_14_0_8_um_filter_43_34]PJA44393.1 MAG: hypothetical protein CO175_03015 [Verrucomicrobia bacterium CG_4_9_14_3_um_fi
MSEQPSTSSFYLGFTGKSRTSTIAFVIGIIGLAVAGYGVWQGVLHDESRPLASWLIGFTVWFSVAIGMLFIIMIWYLFDAGWPVVIRRQLEHAISVFPWLALILLPLILIGWFNHSNPGILWEWMNPDLLLPNGEPVGEDSIYLHKSPLLNLPFFTVRFAFYFTIFTTLAWALRKSSFAMDVDGDIKWARRARVWAAIGTPVLALTVTFAAFDYFMSLSYHWFSTIFGVWFFATSMRAALAVTIILCTVLSLGGHLKGLFRQAHRYELGCMCLAFTIFWAYIAFSQYFLIYNANIPEETFWYNMRELFVDGSKNSWWWIGVGGLVFGYFFIPFLLLLFYRNKIIPARLIFICCWILVFFICDLYFNILPSKENADNVLGYVVTQFSITGFDIAAIIGVGGICAWSFLRSARKRAPIPFRDPRINESVFPKEEDIHHHKY